MATLVTAQNITREALRILHQKCIFIKNVNRQYDDRFKVNGAKAGTDLLIRLPNKFTARTNMTYSDGGVTEQTVTLARSSVAGIDLTLTSMDLQSKLDDFSERILEPAMAQLAATIEANCVTSWLDVPNVVAGQGSAMTFANIMNGRKMLSDNLAPMDNNRALILDTQSNVDIVDATKGLFQDASTISEQYSEGMVGRTAGFKVYESTITGVHTSGTAAATTGYLMNGSTSTGATALVVDTGSTTFKAGDVITVAGVYDVHPETKATRANLKQFVITADVSANATSLPISPTIRSTGALQNVSGLPADNAAISKIGGNATVYRPSLAFHRDAFVFTTADLPMPKGTDMAYQETYEGITMSIVRDFDVDSRDFKTRLDVLYGFKCVRPELACRILAN